MDINELARELQKRFPRLQFTLYIYDYGNYSLHCRFNQFHLFTCVGITDHTLSQPCCVDIVSDDIKRSFSKILTEIITNNLQ